MKDNPDDTPTTAEDVLPAGQDTTVLNGKEAHKGSVAAFVADARTFEAMNADDPRRNLLLAVLQNFLPVFEAVGVLEMFSLRSPELSQRSPNRLRAFWPPVEMSTREAGQTSGVHLHPT